MWYGVGREEATAWEEEYDDDGCGGGGREAVEVIIVGVVSGKRWEGVRGGRLGQPEAQATLWKADCRRLDRLQWHSGL